jgi:coronin-1B/1C/6
VLVLPYTATGKLPRGYPLLNGHSGAVLDTAWCPFNDHLLATGSDDATVRGARGLPRLPFFPLALLRAPRPPPLRPSRSPRRPLPARAAQVKLWTIPEGGLTENIREPTATLEGHGKPVTLLNWNPVANNVLASVGKEPSVRVWDCSRGTTGITLSGFEGLVQDFTWNSNGSEIMTSDKSKAAKIFDVRSGEKTAEWSPHGGGKPFKVVYLGDSGNIVTAGFTAQAKREFKVWSRAAGFDKPLTTIDLDQSAGALLPFYDEDTRVLYLTGKGDGNVRYYEFTDDAPYVHPLTEYRSNVSTKGADFLPKRGLRVMNCEVAHMLKLTGNSVEPIPFIVPRKETTFQEDIFPDTCVLRAAAGGGGRAARPFLSQRAPHPKPPTLPRTLPRRAATLASLAWRPTRGSPGRTWPVPRR